MKNFLGCICVWGECVSFEERGWEVDISKLMGRVSDDGY
jgi:hypothetical protein